MDFSSFSEQLVQQLINGVSLGSIYALIALGYTMVYGIIKLINFAHGDIYMVGAYIGFFATSMLQLPVLPALIISMVVTGLLGMLIERLAYRPLRHAPKVSVLITAIGVSLFLEYTTMFFVSPQPRTFPNVMESVTYHMGPFVVNSQQILILVITTILMVVLTYIVQKTKVGKAMRAVSFDTETAQLMGIDANRVISITFGIGSALAAAGGVLVGVYYNSIDPLMGIMPGLKAFIAAVLGGIGIIPGAMAGGVILGVIESLVSGFLSSTFRDAAAFAILILVLLFKPSGLFGKNTREKV
jgi:branched-chain amino acid transport system permease protein